MTGTTMRCAPPRSPRATYASREARHASATMGMQRMVSARTSPTVPAAPHVLQRTGQPGEQVEALR